jgi:alpha-tubulin suppressor-like RCC1 family protein
MKRWGRIGTTVAAGAVLALTSVAGAGAAGTEVETLGQDSFGQLGNGSAGASFTPQKVLSGASDVAGGREHALALVSGAVFAWGSDAKGQIGDNATLKNVPSPVKVVPSGARAVTTGHYHSMALMNDGTVRAWGWNSRGQMGPNGGTKSIVPTPVTVPLTAAASQVAAGRAHSMALVGGNVWTWGDNTYGQLGLGSADTARHSTPRMVSGLPSIRFIAGGRDTSFAIAGNGDLYAWGNSGYGQAGTGGTGTVLTPKVVLTGVSQVESGADHTIALKSNGTVWTWGRNRFGQLGYSGGNQTRPKQVPGLSSISKVFAGRDHCIVIASGGTVYTWGRNDGGQLGLDPGQVSQTSTPHAISSLQGAVDAGGGQVFSVVLR